ncbi:MAG: bifunctional alpha,alpha-trehalose-phosphate synthase (UDP-forming)/trehalose-phosphatase [Myxococcota bacterium]
MSELDTNSNAERPIVVASNRLPFTIQRGPDGLLVQPAPGGLVSAMDPVLRKRGGTWLGWPGIELRRDESVPVPDRPYDIAPLHLTDDELELYYHGASNGMLWPLLHAMPGRSRFDRRDFEMYTEINDRFATSILEHAPGSGLVWIHDYHLMLAPRRVRAGLPEGVSLAFFLHVPFPPYDVFRLCPWDRELLRSLLSCDLIAFHVRGYARNFLDCAERILGARVDPRTMLVEYGDRTTQVAALPIGIEFETFDGLAKSAERQPELGRERVVLGVDRLDYTKGIPERMRAFERLLELHPEYRENVVMLQVAVPSREEVTEYRDLKNEIDALVGAINGRFATAGWSPIRYLYRSLDRDVLAGLYRDSDVALVTPLRDGMNLVAKEFAACQVNDPGVLILSRLAGAAETMREALLVNPYDLDGTAEELHRALSMGEDERRSRIAALRRREQRDNLDAWTHAFISSAVEARQALPTMSDVEYEGWFADFLKSYRLALFLDYDGTLTPLRDHPDQAVLSPEMREAVVGCAHRADTDVAIVSGRALGGIRERVGEADLTYAGNHGLEIVGPELPLFEHEDLVHYRGRAEELASELDRLATNGAWTERKGPTLTFHYRSVPEALRPGLMRDAHEVVRKAGYQPRDAHCAVEARPPIGWDKGRAVLHILRARYGPSWSESVRVVYLGDDQTDEDAFRFLAGLALTFRVGSPDTPTAATRRLKNVDAVQGVLTWLARRAQPAAG